MRRIGVLLANAKDDPQVPARLAAFTKALQELGWTDGRNIRIDYRFAAADVDRMRAFAKELVSLQPDLIVGAGTQDVAVLQRETRQLRSCSFPFPTRSGADSSPACRVPAETSRASSTSSRR
jgi:putative ABC transport system substrate-binding protein